MLTLLGLPFSSVVKEILLLILLSDDSAVKSIPLNNKSGSTTVILS